MKKISRFLSVFICAVIALTVIASADDQLPVMNAYTTQEGVTLFVESPGAGVEQVYIGNAACQRLTESELGATRTVVLLDNSLSIQEGYRQGIKTFLTDLVAARNDGDTFTIATFSEDVVYLTQDDNDYLAIKEKIDAITFANQKSYFTKALYQVLSDIAESGTIQYTRVIVIADGAENEELGYTDDELYQKIRAVQVPIDTIGCSTGDNAENLKKMFSLSRISNGKDYLIDNTSLPDILQDVIQEENHLVRIDVTPTQAMSDGTVRSVRVNFTGGAYASAEIAMPFWAAAEPEPETETAPAVEPAAEQTGLLRPGEPLFLALCAAAALVLVAVILVIAAALLVYYMTQSYVLGGAVGVIGIVIIAVMYVADSSAFQGAFGNLISALSLTGHFYNFSSGLIDIAGIVYYLSGSFLFLFLADQAVEKRRWC